MPRSSESVAALGGALAKAQAELVNPEKSLIGSVWMGREGEQRTFRYASLASGLDIVRKTLSGQEIATIQTTAVDQAAGLVNLTTMLVHASGEWISSDWPVCPISDLASPRRMGAALTYARRYALFTLVGIAGEDDLDAPDLQEQGNPQAPSSPQKAGNDFDPSHGSGTGQLHKSPPAGTEGGYGSRGRSVSRSAPPVILAPGPSAELRDRLLGEVALIASARQAEDWARKSLPAKNSLVVADAQAVEQAFERRLIDLSDAAEATEAEKPTTQGQGGDEFPEESAEQAAPGAAAVALPPSNELPAGIDKSVLTLSEPKRHRNKEHLRFVAQQPCLVCARTPSDPHHLRFVQPRALGRKVSDEFVVPLCRTHHRALHRVGNEPGWWKATGIDPLDVARRLWGQSRLIAPTEPAAVQAAPEFLPVAADPRAGKVPPSQTARRGRRRINNSGIDGSADGRKP